MPRLITRQDLANSVAERFYEQYGPKFGIYPFGDTGAIYSDLRALGETPSIDGVEKLCKGWTRLSCDDCENSVDVVVQVGQKPDYESRTADLCIDCARAAVKLFESVGNQ